MMFETVHGEFYTSGLIHAAYCNDIETLEDYILEGEIDINDNDAGGSTALHYAVQNKNKETEPRSRYDKNHTQSWRHSNY